MKKQDLTVGNIKNILITLSLPIMGSSFIQMSYTFMDMLWLGRLNTKSLSAAGGAGNLYWILMSVLVLLRIGTEIGVGQSMGEKDEHAVGSFMRVGLISAFATGFLFMVIFIVFGWDILRIYKFSPEVHSLSYDYLKIISLTLPIFFVNSIISAIYHGMGNAKTPFYINSVGVVTNILLDPIMIFSMNLGIQGAAYATLIADLAVLTLFLLPKKHGSIYIYLKKGGMKVKESLVKVWKWGSPASLQNFVFSGIGMLMARLMNSTSEAAYAAYQVGIQVESIGWMTFQGFSTALGSLVAQNYGAKQIHRVEEGYVTGRKLVSKIGLGVGIVLFAFSPFFAKLFIPDNQQTLEIATQYLRIIALAQVFSAWESAATGYFNGLGQTKIPSFVSISGNVIRIPLALFLTHFLGIKGFWITMATSMAFKGIVMRYLAEKKTWV